MDLRPLGDRIIVRPLARNEKIGSIHIPDTASERPQEGTVLAIGPDVTTVLAGERIVYSKYMGTEVNTGDEPLLILGVDAVLAVRSARAVLGV